MQNSECEKLAKRLKQLCDDDGKEKKEHLDETSDILDKLGLVYMSQSPDKLSLIRSATFFNAVIVRRISNNEYIGHLQSLCVQVLEKSPAEKKDADLIQISRDIFSKVEEMRHHTKKRLSEIDPIPSGLSDTNLRKAQNEKIALVRKLQNEITDRYTEIMADVSDECMKVMGDPPENCRFAVVGMGSLARKEITPYSDFEHIILLEKGARVRYGENKYKEIVEFFRWLSVIFNVILINFGETIVRSVAAPYLNDDTIDGGDWFYDNHTPCGIKFDGMQKSAWKFPLGKALGKEGDFELIKPVDEMVDYLVSEEDNGYLPDILIKTNFVFGDRQVYEDYQLQVQETIDTNPDKVNLQMKKQLEKNLEEFNAYVNIAAMQAAKNCNIKYLIYRTSRMFISYIGRLFSPQCFSCFEIIDSLSSQTSHDNSEKLLYAVAVACETRLKVYTAQKGQDDIAGERNFRQSDAKTLEKLKEIMGEQSLGDYLLIVRSLYLKLRFENNEDILTQDFVCSRGEQATIFMSLDLRDRCKKFETILVSNEAMDITEEMQLRNSLARTYIREESFDKALDVINLPAVWKKVVESHVFDISDNLRQFVFLVAIAMECCTRAEHPTSASNIFSFLKEMEIQFGTRHFDFDFTHLLRGFIQLNEGFINYENMEYAKAVICFENGIFYFEKLIGNKKCPFAGAVLAQCHLRAGMGRSNDPFLERAIKHGEEALRLYQTANLEIAFECECYSLLGVCHMLQNEPAIGLDYLQKELSLRMTNRPLEQRSYDVLLCKNYIGFCKAMQRIGFLRTTIKLSKFYSTLRDLKIRYRQTYSQSSSRENFALETRIEYLSNNLMELQILEETDVGNDFSLQFCNLL